MLVLIFGAALVSLAATVLWRTLSGARTASASHNLFTGMLVQDLRQALLQHGASDRAVRPAVERIAERARKLTPAGRLDALEHKILLAGAPAAFSLERVLTAKVLLGGAGAAVGVLRFVSSPGALSLLLGVVAGALGFVAPDVFLSGRATERQQKITRAIPDTLDQMTVSVEAGLGFEAAMARAGRNGSGPFAEELVRTLQDIQAGMGRGEALRALGDRTDVAELRHFVAAVIQAESYGIPTAQVLRVQANELRIKRRQDAEERALKLPVKILFPLILCIFPALFIVLLGPAGIQISQTLLK